ncbi:uncharacterized protein LOC143020141 [Oratosquilla oratoria]|uniref:uncharacterized protein LOC143020141 n=1 Tax=Oratosquilla oratoria TaxID=337810 RepID=UPI003F759EF0
MIDRLSNIEFTDKRLISFDTVSPYTNINIEGVIRAIREAVQQIDSDKLPLNKRDYLELVEKCMKFASFTFNNKEYHQHEGLPIGPPLSAVSASLYMEMLETEHISLSIPNASKWFRYVDDCLFITQKTTDIHDLQRKLNNIDNKIQVTVEEENNGQLPFLDTVTIRSGNSAKFKVYRKPTNKDDYIPFFSAHDDRTKSGEVIGFYFRSLRICWCGRDGPFKKKGQRSLSVHKKRPFNVFGYQNLSSSSNMESLGYPTFEYRGVEEH